MGHAGQRRAGGGRAVVVGDDGLVALALDVDATTLVVCHGRELDHAVDDVARYLDWNIRRPKNPRLEQVNELMLPRASEIDRA